MAQAWAKAFYNSTQWQQCREAILKRDKYRCQTPGCYNPAEDVHHKTKLTQKNINDPMVSLNPENLISLCGDCHKAKHERDKREGRLKKVRYMQQDILPEVEFDADGYPIEVARKAPRGGT